MIITLWIENSKINLWISINHLKLSNIRSWSISIMCIRITMTSYHVYCKNYHVPWPSIIPTRLPLHASGCNNDGNCGLNRSGQHFIPKQRGNAQHILHRIAFRFRPRLSLQTLLSIRLWTISCTSVRIISNMVAIKCPDKKLSHNYTRL